MDTMWSGADQMRGVLVSRVRWSGAKAAACYRGVMDGGTAGPVCTNANSASRTEPERQSTLDISCAA